MAVNKGASRGRLGDNGSKRSDHQPQTIELRVPMRTYSVAETFGSATTAARRYTWPPCSCVLPPIGLP